MPRSAAPADGMWRKPKIAVAENNTAISEFVKGWQDLGRYFVGLARAIEEAADPPTCNNTHTHVCRSPTQLQKSKHLRSEQLHALHTRNLTDGIR